MKKLLLGLISIVMLGLGQNIAALYTVKVWNPYAFTVKDCTIHTQGFCQKSDTSDILPGQIKEREIGGCTGTWVEASHVEYNPSQCLRGTVAGNPAQTGTGSGSSSSTSVVVMTGTGAQAQTGSSVNPLGIMNVKIKTSPSHGLPSVGTSTGGTIWYAVAMNLYDENGNCKETPTASLIGLRDAPF